MVVKTIIYNVEAEHEGKNLGIYLKYVKGISSRQIVKLKHIDNGILKNSVHARTNEILSAGDEITLNFIDTPKKELEKSTVEVDILYEDEDVIVYNKPPNMPCHPAKRYQQDTLANVYAAHRSADVTCRIMNRLDKDTSGAVVMAKHMLSASGLTGNIAKSYIALVCGNPKTKNGTINEPIGRPNEKYTIRAVMKDGQHAVTHFTVLEEYNSYSLVRFIIDTGRTHQIRVHMSHIGHPLAGDDMYGGDLNIITRHALHCEFVSFIHPITKKKIELIARMADDISDCIKTLKRDSNLR